MLRTLDLALLRLLRTRGHAPPVEAAIVRFTRAGEHGLVWYAVAGAGFVVDAERRPFYVRAMRAVVAAQVASTLVKLVVSRARPLLEELPALTPSISGRSYPSAHASTSFAAARVLAQPLPAGPLYAGAVAMALSRPYVGVHYPSDVLAGAALGHAVGGLLS